MLLLMATHSTETCTFIQYIHTFIMHTTVTHKGLNLRYGQSVGFTALFRDYQGEPVPEENFWFSSGQKFSSELYGARED